MSFYNLYSNVSLSYISKFGFCVSCSCGNSLLIDKPLLTIAEKKKKLVWALKLEETKLRVSWLIYNSKLCGSIRPGSEVQSLSMQIKFVRWRRKAHKKTKWRNEWSAVFFRLTAALDCFIWKAQMSCYIACLFGSILYLGTDVWKFALF